MPKILIESKMLKNNKNGVLKLRINNERVEELKNVMKLILIMVSRHCRYITVFLQKHQKKL